MEFIEIPVDQKQFDQLKGYGTVYYRNRGRIIAIELSKEPTPAGDTTLNFILPKPGIIYYRAVLGDIVVDANDWDEANAKIEAEIKAGNVPILEIAQDPALDESGFHDLRPNQEVKDCTAKNAEEN